MKNSILIFVLLFSFSFVSCAQSNNDLDNRDIAMVDNSNNEILTTTEKNTEINDNGPYIFISDENIKDKVRAALKKKSSSIYPSGTFQYLESKKYVVSAADLSTGKTILKIYVLSNAFEVLSSKEVSSDYLEKFAAGTKN